MMIQGHDDQLLSIIYFLTVIAIPGIVLWFDDATIHSNQKK